MNSPNNTDTTPPQLPRHHKINITRIFLDGFLAFLLILLIVASVVVLRSFMIRRRSRSRFQDALEAGFVLDAQGNLVPVQRPKPIGEKPMIWEVWVDEQGNADNPSEKIGYHTWDDGRATPWKTILPISARPMAPNKLKGPDATANTLEQNLTRLPTSRKSYESSLSTPGIQKLEVSVLISMPTPNRRVVQSQGAKNVPNSKVVMEQSEIPEVVFGVTRVVVHS